jgi:hypothetical protein
MLAFHALRPLPPLAGQQLDLSLVMGHNSFSITHDGHPYRYEEVPVAFRAFRNRLGTLARAPRGGTVTVKKPLGLDTCRRAGTLAAPWRTTRVTRDKIQTMMQLSLRDRRARG